MTTATDMLNKGAHLRAHLNRTRYYVHDDYGNVWGDNFKSKEAAKKFIRKHKGTTPYLGMDGKITWGDF